MGRPYLFVIVCMIGCRGGCGDDSQDNADAQVYPDAGPDERVCENLPPSPTCEVTAGSTAKLSKGNILTPQLVLRGGEVAIDESGQITCVGCDCAQGGETTIVCASGTVSPGLINTHD